jgi:mono/diheme cytochrome c family protein
MSEFVPNPTPRARQGTDYAEHEDVQQVHAAIQREKREPRVGLEPLSIWLIAVYGLALFFGGAYLGRFSGNFSGESLDIAYVTPKGHGPAGPGGGAESAAPLTSAERGKKIFSANCATCHQMTGTGVAGQYPPLAGSEFVNGGTRRLGMIVLKGLQGPLNVKGVMYGTAVMQPWESTLNDQKIADVLTFVRQEWGNKGGPVEKEGIAGLRKELAPRKESWHEPDILAVPADANLPGGEPAADKAGQPPAPQGSPAAAAPPKA